MLYAVSNVCILLLFSLVTRPLLRQIENLQSTYAAQTASYERVEKSLTDRLGKCILKYKCTFI